MHLKNAVSPMPNIVVFAHRPNYDIRMQRLQAFKYELRPDGQQERQMRRFAGSCRFACEVSDAVGSPAAGTHRSDSGVAQCRPLSAVGISGLQAVEDVK